MIDKDDRIAVFAVRVVDIENPVRGSMRDNYCVKCNAEVWISPATKSSVLDHFPNADIICNRCGPQIVEEEEIDEFCITEEIAEELLIAEIDRERSN